MMTEQPFTKELRQEIVDDFCRRHGGEYDAAEFLAEVKKRGERHPAHAWFTWDDDAAAHEYRLWQARTFVRGLRVTYEVKQVHRGKLRVVRCEAPALVSPVEGREAGGGYVRVDPENPDTMRVLCHEAAVALKQWIKRYGGALTYAGGDPQWLGRVLERLDPDNES